MAPRRLGLIGAECTGKSTLAVALAAEFDAAIVPEYLRAFVDLRGRTPTREEQYLVLWNQSRAEEEVASTTARQALVCDPAPLMTSLYSLAYFEDRSLLEAGLSHARGYDLLVWCDADIPWAADGAQRDGEPHRQQVHALIGAVLAHESGAADLQVLRVSGDLDARVAAVRSVWLPEALPEST